MSSLEASDRTSLAGGAAFIAVAAAVSRVTGFLRVIAVAAAMGTTFFANTYQSANTAPNLIFELVAAGVLTSVFVPTFVDYLVQGRKEEGWEAANALTSVALVGLTGIALILGLAAPLIMRLLLVGVDPSVRPEALDVGTQFLRLFAPQIVFYGAGMIMTGALHAHRRFSMPAIAPIFNNVIVIAVYVGYMVLRGSQAPDVRDVSAAEIWLLGAGTTAGVVAMTLCLIPGLKRLGWGFRFTWQPGHPAVRKGARLGAWALGYAGGYQAGLIVVLVLANRIEGGVAAYQWAFTFFYLPHALVGIPIFKVLFTAMAEHAAGGEMQGVLNRLNDGMRMLAFILVPAGVLMVVLAEPLIRSTLSYGAMTEAGTGLIARVLAAFALGLPFYSAFLVYTRGFYALSETKTPTLMNALTVLSASGTGAVLFISLPDDWKVPGLALGHSIGFGIGAFLLAGKLGRRLESDLPRQLWRQLTRHTPWALAAGLSAWFVRALIGSESRVASFFELGIAGALGVFVYGLLMRARGSEELHLLARVLRYPRGGRERT